MKKNILKKKLEADSRAVLSLQKKNLPKSVHTERLKARHLRRTPIFYPSFPPITPPSLSLAVNSLYRRTATMAATFATVVSFVNLSNLQLRFQLIELRR